MGCALGSTPAGWLTGVLEWEHSWIDSMCGGLHLFFGYGSLYTRLSDFAAANSAAQTVCRQRGAWVHFAISEICTGRGKACEG